MSARWKPFPYADPEYDCVGAKLKRRWAQLHRGDCEPFPDAATLKRLVAKHPKLKPSVSLDTAADRLQDAWRAFHAGDFTEAVKIGLALGPLGVNVTNKATNVYATYLEPNGRVKAELFHDVAQRAEELQSIAPSFVNGWYLHAQALGRYAQSVSVAKALAEGIAGKVKGSLDEALRLEKDHADAHIGLGLYHAEIIHSLGALIGRMTYGVSEQEAVKHFRAALKLNPHSAIAHVEFANGLVMLSGKSKLDEARKLYAEAAKCEPHDAMERLDVQLAKDELAD